MSHAFRFLAALAISLLPAVPALALAPEDVAGEYTGVVDNGSFEHSGYFRMVIGKAGKGSVAVRLGDEPVCVVLIGIGPIGGGGGGGFFIPIEIIGGDPDMIVRVIIKPDPEGNPVVIGEVEDDGHTFEVEAPKSATDGGTATGRHTFMIGSTPGIGNSGAGTARVSPKGRVTGVASVKGGRPVTFGGRLSPAQALPIAARLGRTERSLVGSMTFDTPATTGAVTLHTEAGDQGLLVGGMPYDPHQPALTGPTPSFLLNVKVNDVNAGLAVRARNGTIVDGRLNGAPLRLSVSRATGSVTGRSGTQFFRGVALQGLNKLGGLVNGASIFEVEVATGASGTLGAVVKQGVGDLQLAGANAYLGGVNLGGLAVNGNVAGGWLVAAPEFNLELGLALQAQAANATLNAGTAQGIDPSAATAGGSVTLNGSVLQVNGAVNGTIAYNGSVESAGGTLALGGGWPYVGSAVTLNTVTDGTAPTLVNGGQIDVSGGTLVVSNWNAQPVNGSLAMSPNWDVVAGPDGAPVSSSGIFSVNAWHLVSIDGGPIVLDPASDPNLHLIAPADPTPSPTP